METSGDSSDVRRGSMASTSASDHRYHDFGRHNGNNQFSLSRFLLSPLLDYMGISQAQSASPSASLDRLINDRSILNDSSSSGELSIRIDGSGEQDHDRGGSRGSIREETDIQSESLVQSISRTSSAATMDTQGDSRSDRGVASIRGSSDSMSGNVDVEAADGVGVNNNNNNSSRDSPIQRYTRSIQQAARWAEQILPFSLLLLVVFIRQHLEGVLVLIWITVFMFKSNDILRNQTALKGERKISVLVSLSLLSTFHVAGFYWWLHKDDLLYSLVMIPPKTTPPFWHAMFIVMVNDTLVRQATMVLKCVLLMYYKNSRGRNRREQGQMLTLVEYLLLLYRALLPAPVWYRFFLNKEYGSLFSSLMTGLYLTFKLTSVIDKVRSFISALKALSRQDIHYGASATFEQVNAVGDICAICQEKMHAPVVLLCKHVFCEECVSEWFERERTCPLCRSLVRPAGLRSFGDGSTSLYFQFF
ncbi:uncharacterized protein [Rutidosis leptorrhynchoides]|uniref:uncharacterized protein isoform X2 n=1 Tax=Rutidosis leptorrhynchoides TaxID=125765 RepID=UPI003A98EB10